LLSAPNISIASFTFFPHPPGTGSLPAIPVITLAESETKRVEALSRANKTGFLKELRQDVKLLEQYLLMMGLAVEISRTATMLTSAVPKVDSGLLDCDGASQQLSRMLVIHTKTMEKLVSAMEKVVGIAEAFRLSIASDSSKLANYAHWLVNFDSAKFMQVRMCKDVADAEKSGTSTIAILQEWRADETSLLQMSSVNSHGAKCAFQLAEASVALGFGEHSGSWSNLGDELLYEQLGRFVVSMQSLVGLVSGRSFVKVSFEDMKTPVGPVGGE
jgi:hypothetical protein